MIQYIHADNYLRSFKEISSFNDAFAIVARQRCSQGETSSSYRYSQDMAPRRNIFKILPQEGSKTRSEIQKKILKYGCITLIIKISEVLYGQG